MSAAGLTPTGSTGPPRAPYVSTSRQLRAILWSLLLLAIAVGIISVLIFYTFSDSSDSIERIEVVSVYSQEEALAIAELENSGLEVIVEREINVLIPQGLVYDQDPRPGAKLNSGDLVTIFISEGGELRVIPEITGQDVIDAERILTSEPFGFQTQTEFVTDSELPGVVIRQEPVAGERRVPGDTILLVVSLGAENIPDVRGIARQEAIDLLETMGYGVAVEEIPSLDVAENMVIATRPMHGAPVPDSGIITLLISSGQRGLSDLTVPSVVGFTEEVARFELEASGLTVRVVYRNTSLGETRGVVVEQSPEAGSRAAFGDLVRLVITRPDGGQAG